MQYYYEQSMPLPLQETPHQHYQAIQAHSASSNRAPPLYLPYSFYKVICQHQMHSQNILILPLWHFKRKNMIQTFCNLQRSHTPSNRSHTFNRSNITNQFRKTSLYKDDPGEDGW